LASSAFIPPYWLRQRWKVTSETSSAFATSAIDLPSPSINSASRSFLMTWLGVWRFAFTFGSSLPITVSGKNSHTSRTDLRGSGQCRIDYFERFVARVPPLAIDVPASFASDLTHFAERRVILLRIGLHWS